MALDCYKILGVLKAATAGEIRKAYHKGALKWHPDKNPDHKDEAERRFRHLSEAYEVLKDPLKRAEYDRVAAAKEEVLKPKVSPPPPPGAAARATSRGAADATKATGGADIGGTGGWDWCWGGTGSATYTGSARPGAAWATDAGGAGTRAAKSARRPATGARTHSPRSTGESERNKYCYRYRANGKAKAKAGDSHYRSTDNYYRHRSPDTARAGHYNYDNGAQIDNPFRSSSHCSPDSARVGDNHYDNGAQTDNPFRSDAHRSPNSARTGDNLYGWGARADNQYRSSSRRRSPDSARAGGGAFRYRDSPRAGDNHYRDGGRADHHYRNGTSNFDDYYDNGAGNGDNLHRKRCQGCRLRRQWCPDW